MIKIGITEQGDAGLNFNWANKLQQMHWDGTLRHMVSDYDGAVLITKNAQPSFQKILLSLYHEKHYHNILLHLTCTGWGYTPMEPNVPNTDTQLSYLEDLLKAGFPINHVVLRLDPIIPTPEGLERAKQVLSHPIVQKYKYQLQVRISVIDLYAHTKQRMSAAGYTLPNLSFRPTKTELQPVLQLLQQFPEFHYETCAEDTLCEMAWDSDVTPLFIENNGCISYKELELFQLPTNQLPTGGQRSTCHCLACKSELLNQRHRCPHHCLYCYWKDN